MLQSFIKLIKIHMHHYIHITKIKTLAFFFHEFYGHECWDHLTIIHDLCITLLVDIKANPTCNSQHYVFYSFMRLFCINEMKIIPPITKQKFLQMFNVLFWIFITSQPSLNLFLLTIDSICEIYNFLT